MYDINTLQISSTHPCLIIYLLDQSGSMSEFFNDGTSKAEKLADAVNEIIFQTGLKCISGSGVLKNRFELSVIGYGLESHTCSPAWEGSLRSHWVVSINDIFNNPVGEKNEMPIWITPKAGYATPMKNAFENAARLCEAWINWGNHRDCHPPIIINITDGEPTDSGLNDSQLLSVVNNLKQLGTNYGNVSIFNIHITKSSNLDSVLYPSLLPMGTQSARLLFELSTPLNESMISHARSLGYEVDSGAVGYVYNGSAKNLLDFLNIGSNPL